MIATKPVLFVGTSKEHQLLHKYMHITVCMSIVCIYV